MSVVYPYEKLIPSLRDLWKKAFGDEDDFLDIFYNTAYAPDRCRCVAEDGKVQAVLYWFDCELEGKKLAYIYAVATDPDYRGKGLCKMVMEDTMEVLRDRGYAGAVLLPQEEWLINRYAGMGFTPCTTVTEKWCRAGEAVPVRKIDVSEYAALRRKLLPGGGIIQEGENLVFLGELTALYAGETFIAAVSAEEELWCPEVLGDPNALPGLVKTLGFSEGRARMPGTERPFAMFRPLTKDCPKPGYFGLVFD